MLNFGNAIDTSEIFGISKPILIETMVQIIKAKICDGKYLLNLFGIPNTIANVRSPSRKACIFIVLSDVVICSILSIVFENGCKPNRGFNCIIIIIVPTPFIKPEITGYGTYFTMSVSFVNESSS